MKKIIVASKNPVKVNATLNAFKKVFPKEKFASEGVEIKSNVSDQPMSDSETYEGALNRAINASNEKEGDYFVGIEGGIEESLEGMASFAWVVIKSKEKLGRGKTATFFLPKQVAELIKAGMELGDADDKVFGRSNSKQQNGAIGILTKDKLTRTALYEPAIIIALIPFVNKDLY